MGRVRIRIIVKIEKEFQEKDKFSPHIRENQENTNKFKNDKQQKMMMNHNKFSMHTFKLRKSNKMKKKWVKKIKIINKWILFFLLMNNKLHRLQER